MKKNNLNDFYYSFSKIDWVFLLFLVGTVNFKIYVKLFAILSYLLFVIYRKYQFPKEKTSVVNFYFLIPLIGLIAPLTELSSINPVYWLGYTLGLLQWLAAGAAFYLIYTTIKNKSSECMLKTVDAFFIFNIIYSLVQLVFIMIAAHSFMPYWDWDPSEKYGASTGDHLHGILGGNSITNAAIFVLAAVYYLRSERLLLSLLSILIVLLCTSNISIFILLFGLAMLFTFTNRRQQRKHILICFVFIFAFYPFLSPVNIEYIQTIYKTVTSKLPRWKSGTSDLTAEDSLYYMDSLKYGIYRLPKGINILKLSVDEKSPENNIRQLKLFKENNEHFRNLKNKQELVLDSDIVRSTFHHLYGLYPSQAPIKYSSKIGKVYTLKQTLGFLRTNVKNGLFGAGTGRFSSKLALKMTGLGLQGKYPDKAVYASLPFLEYHFYTILYFLSRDISQHSALNFPNSVYNQIAGEYGLLGIAAFILLYVGFFWKQRKRSKNVLYLLVVALLFFNFDYWFEMMSFTVIFELLILLDIFATTDNAKLTAPGNDIDAHI